VSESGWADLPGWYYPFKNDHSMNPHSHRLIFNPTRGCLMAVAETSRSSGKSSASGTTRSARTKSARCSRRAEIQASNRPLALVSIARAATNSIAHIALQAARNVQLQAAANTNTISNRNDSNNVGAGVNIGLGQQSGISFQVSANQANGRANGTETTYDNTRITASNTLSVKSGADTTLAGAQLAGDTVKMDVGGKLNIETLQDSSTYSSEQHSSGFSVSVCVPPICYGVPVTGSVSMANQSLDHNYQSATGQSGVAAGAGGYDIKVAGNTDLKGAAITSTATPDKNTLQTASLTSSDLDNHQNTNSSSSSLNLGYSGASTLATLAQNAVSNGLGNLGGGAGMPENGSQSGKTSSVISPGNIVITGTGNKGTDEASQQQVATLTSRDAKTANQTLSNTLTLQQAQAVQEQQKTAQENAQAGQLVGSVAFNVVGDIAQKNGWKDSSPQKIALHAIAGFIQASAAGQNGATGALAAMGNEAFTQAVNAYIDKALPTPTVKDPQNPTAEETAQLRENALSRKALAESAASLLGATAVALAGGSNQQIALGGNVALNADRFNRQLHPDEAKLISKLAADKAAKSCQSGDTSCLNSQTLFWKDTLERVASSLVDDKANAVNTAYLAQLSQASANPSSEGARGGLQNYVDALQQAQSMLSPYMGKTIVVNGQTATADGSVQTYFSATSAQRADEYANTFLGSKPSSIAPLKDLRDEARVERFGAQNGTAKPDYTLEETLLGGKVADKALGTIGKFLGSEMDVAAAGTAQASAGGNISANKITNEGLPVKVSTAETALLKQLDTLPNTQAQGALREYVADNFYLRNGFTKLDGKCGSNCFDGVYVKDGRIFINEVKPLNADGTIKLSGNSGSSIGAQMSDQWIASRAKQLAQNGTPEQQVTGNLILDALKPNGAGITRIVTGVDAKGITIVKLPGS
jgi:filamentous hemagglutinin